jgi:hypothetical protein
MASLKRLRTGGLVFPGMANGNQSGLCPPRMWQGILLCVGSNDLEGPITPTNRMTIRIRGIWRPGSATSYGLQTTGIGGQWGFSRFLPLVEVNITIFSDIKIQQRSELQPRVLP